VFAGGVSYFMIVVKVREGDIIMKAGKWRIILVKFNNRERLLSGKKVC
jgi:hypothetical protein